MGNSLKWAFDRDREQTIIRIQCDAPAPLVVNGAAYVGCQLTKEHGGAHEVKIYWSGNGSPYALFPVSETHRTTEGER